MIIIQVGPGPRFVPLVSRTDAGVWVAAWALAIIVASQYSIADSGVARMREAVAK